MFGPKQGISATKTKLLGIGIELGHAHRPPVGRVEQNRNRFPGPRPDAPQGPGRLGPHAAVPFPQGFDQDGDRA